MEGKIEIRDGKTYRVEVLPDADPPVNRSPRTRYHLADVGKAGNIPRRRRRKKKHG